MLKLYILTREQKAAIHVAKLLGSAILGSVAALTFVHFFGAEAFFITMLAGMTIYALREVYLIKLAELERQEKLEEITKNTVDSWTQVKL
jgi:predicted membrane protein